MTDSMRAVIVFYGRNEFEAQLARDILKSAGIPVIHIPSLSTGMFGVRQTTRVAVPEEYVDDAIEELQEQGLDAHVSETPRWLSAFAETARDKVPVHRNLRLPRESHLWRVLAGLAAAIALLLVWLLLGKR